MCEVGEVAELFVRQRLNLQRLFLSDASAIDHQPLLGELENLGRLSVRNDLGLLRQSLLRGFCHRKFHGVRLQIQVGCLEPTLSGESDDQGWGGGSERSSTAGPCRTFPRSSKREP